jgi:hypothetical protein
MPGSKRAKQRRGKKPTKNREDERMAKAMCELEAFEKFKDEILPALRRDLDKKMSAEEILQKYATLAAARGISIALSEKDAGKALSAVKNILDRVQGKATERREVKHQYEDLPDEELDAILMSEMQDLEGMTEAVTKPQKKRGRPKGSKNKPKAKSSGEVH